MGLLKTLALIIGGKWLLGEQIKANEDLMDADAKADAWLEQAKKAHAHCVKTRAFWNNTDKKSREKRKKYFKAFWKREKQSREKHPLTENEKMEMKRHSEAVLKLDQEFNRSKRLNDK